MLEIVLFCVNFGRGPRVDFRPPLLPWMKPLDTRVTRSCTERAAATHWADVPEAMARTSASRLVWPPEGRALQGRASCGAAAVGPVASHS